MESNTYLKNMDAYIKVWITLDNQVLSYGSQTIKYEVVNDKRKLIFAENARM